MEESHDMQTENEKTSAASDAAITRDPVCRMTVDLGAGKPTHKHGGHVYHFCCNSCRDNFAAAPHDYVEAKDPVCGMEVDRAPARHFAWH